jgi:hypothetical protein
MYISYEWTAMEFPTLLFEGQPDFEITLKVTRENDETPEDAVRVALGALSDHVKDRTGTWGHVKGSNWLDTSEVKAGRAI